MERVLGVMECVANVLRDQRGLERPVAVEQIVNMHQLVNWLSHEADMVDATGTTQAGYNLRLAAATLSDLVTIMNGKIAELAGEVRRLETEYSRGLV